MGRLPLTGVRIVDFTWAGVGGYCSFLWGLLGAELIKIETGSRGGSRTSNPVRRRGPGGSSLFEELNLNKRSISLNMQYPQAQALVKVLIRMSDLIGENFRPGVMERWGMGYSEVRKMRPDIVMVSMSVSGQTGPARLDSGYAGVFAALSGVSHLIGYEDGPPVELRFPSDMSCGTMGAFAGLAGLLHRQQTGEGQYIDCANREALGSFIGEALMEYAVNGRDQMRKGNRDELWAPHGCYPCKGEHEGGRWISIAVTKEEEWLALVHVMGSPAWTQEQRFATASQRRQHAQELDTLIAQWTSKCDAFDLMDRLQAAGVPALPTMYPEDVLNNAHLQARGSWQVLERTGEPRIMFGAPWRFSETPCVRFDPAPTLGQQNMDVFGELLGLSEQHVQDLVQQGAIA